MPSPFVKETFPCNKKMKMNWKATVFRTPLPTWYCALLQSQNTCDSVYYNMTFKYLIHYTHLYSLSHITHSFKVKKKDLLALLLTGVSTTVDSACDSSVNCATSDKGNKKKCTRNLSRVGLFSWFGCVTVKKGNGKKKILWSCKCYQFFRNVIQNGPKNDIAQEASDSSNVKNQEKFCFFSRSSMTADVGP